MRSGLDRAAGLPVGRFTAELLAGARLEAGRGAEAFARGELAAHPTDWLTAFGFAEAAVGPSTPAFLQAGVGARVVF